MDTMLLGVTVVALLVAAASSTVAWRLFRADRARHASRVAALAAAAGLDSARPESHEAAGPASPEPGALDEFVAAGPTRGPDASALADGIIPTGAIFTRPGVDSGSSNRQHRLLGAAAVFALLVTGVAGALVVSGRTPGAGPSLRVTPLELVALGHQRADGALAISGLVRNPDAAPSLPAVDAEVRVFDAAGILIATRSVALGAVPLAAGQEAPFAVTLGDLPTAARYRVSFSSGGAMLPHVDRRTNLPAAVTADAR
ncbi:MAG: FxLYD domain-containing protein [Vicinamibacterales bacterium]